MSPETIEALNDCEKAARKILTPWSILDHWLGISKSWDEQYDED